MNESEDETRENHIRKRGFRKRWKKGEQVRERKLRECERLRWRENRENDDG